MADRNGYIGRAPSDSSVTVARQTFSPTGVQTNFTFASGYTPGYLDAYLNGVKLVVAQDFTATDGSVVGLTTAAASGDILELVAFKAFNATSVSNAGTLSVSGNQTNDGTLSVTGGTTLSNLNVSGITTVGAVDLNGSVLTLDADGDTTITADTDDQIDIAFGGNDRLTLSTGLIDLKNDGSQSAIRLYCESSNAHYAALQAPAHSAFSGNITLTLPATTDTLVARTTTDTLTNKTLTSPTITTPTITGDASFSGSVSIGGTLTYEDVTNIDSVGVVTARQGIVVVGGGITAVGVVTATSFVGDGSSLTGVASTDNINTSTLAQFTGGVGIADSIFHIGDDNTAIRFPAADTFTVETSGSERLRVDSNGFVGLGENSPSSYDGGGRDFVIKSSGTTGMTIVSDSSNSGNIYFADGTSGNEAFRGRIEYSHANDRLQFGTAGTGSLVNIDSSGRLLVNDTSSTSPDGFDSLIQVNASNHEGSITIGRHTANANGPALLFQKSRSGSATPGTGVVSDDDVLGIIRFYGSDGTDRNSFAANIACEVDGTPGGDDLPGRLVFSTTADGAATATERLRITSEGYIGVNDSSPGRAIDVLFDDATTYSETALAPALGAIRIFNNSTTGNSTAGEIVFGTGDSGTAYATISAKRVGSQETELIFRTSDSATLNEALRIDKSGHVQIQPNGSSELRLQFGGNGTRIENTTSGGHMDFYTNNAVRIRNLYNGQGTEFSNQSSVRPTTDNAVDLGTSGGRYDDVFATNGTIQTSDSRLKREVETSVLGIDFVKALRPVSYKWIEGKKVPIVDGTDENGENIYRTDADGNWVYESRDGARRHWGFIAQEVKQAVDDASVDFAGWSLADKDDPDSTQSLRYEEFISPLTKALQEAIAKIETLETNNAALTARVAALEA